MYITLFMTKYLNRLGAAIIIAASTTACTEVDDRLGAGMLPENQQMEIEMTTFSNGVKTYLYREDSIPSSRTGYAFFGRMKDDENVFGAQTSSVLLQFLPMALPYTSADGFGIEPIVDSMCIVLALNDVRGDTTRVQNFDVYDVVRNETRGVLERGKMYYNNFPISEYRGEKLFSFSHTGKRNVQAKLFPTAAGKKYLESIVALKEDNWKIFKDDSLFRAKYQGLYITPAEGSPAAAAVYAADLASSGLLLYVRNHDSLDVTAIYDTIVSPFSFADTDIPATNTSAAVYWDNVSVNMTAFDYTSSAFGNVINDTLATSAPLEKVYIQTMAGVGTYLRFTDELVEQIRGLGGDDNVDIMINQAMMRIYPDGDVEDYRVLDRSLARLGSYRNVKYLSPIPDYLYSEEVAQQQRDATYRLPYNGWLNRSNGYYEFDITSYTQQLAKERNGEPGYKFISPVVLLAPEAYSIYSFGTTTLRGYVENPTEDNDRLITIRLTYTIIKGKTTQDE